MASRAYRSAGLVRSLALLWSFLLASGTILVAAALVLSSVLTQRFQEQVLDDSAREVALYTSSVLIPSVVRGDRVVATAQTRRRLLQTVRSTPKFRQISVWSSSGRLVVSTAPRRQTPRPGDDVRRPHAAGRPGRRSRWSRAAAVVQRGPNAPSSSGRRSGRAAAVPRRSRSSSSTRGSWTRASLGRRGRCGSWSASCSRSSGLR